jgi:hypothetical protein
MRLSNDTTLMQIPSGRTVPLSWTPVYIYSEVGKQGMPVRKSKNPQFFCFDPQIANPQIST